MTTFIFIRHGKLAFIFTLPPYPHYRCQILVDETWLQKTLLMNAIKTIPKVAGHPLWVKLTHWVGTISFLLLLFSGMDILMVHPRFSV